VLHDPDPGQSVPHRRIAVIGAGIAGLSAAWLLSQRHAVRVYETAGWLGGHAHTVDVDTPHGPLAVDTGFIVYNDLNYPNFSALLDHLGVPSVETRMSFAASTGAGSFEYSSDLMGIVGQKRNLARPFFWKMLHDITRFYGHAASMLESPELAGLTLGDFLKRHNYSGALVDHHILPMCAAIWSSSTAQIRAFPMQAFVRFFASHQLFSLGRRVNWRTVRGGSRAYVEALTRAAGFDVETSNGARRIYRDNGLVIVEDARGERDVFTDVVLATHADTSLALLADADLSETRLLGAFRYTDNLAVLHDDPAFMPKRRHVWASWNYIGAGPDRPDEALCVSYWMNRLQGLDRRHPLFVTLNPGRLPQPAAIRSSFVYTHPLFDHAALEAQRDLWRLQGQRNTWFCGSYFGYGFHEDALQSGLAVAENFGVRRPWSVPNPSGRITVEPVPALAPR
jgi:predicted NAD/FAD-binding protein